MQNVTPDMFWTFLVVFVILLGVALTTTGLIKNIRDLRKTSKQDESSQHERYMGFFQTDKLRIDGIERRLDPIEKNADEQSKDIRVLMSGMLALLDHELHNGNAEQMETAKRNIETRLINK